MPLLSGFPRRKPFPISDIGRDTQALCRVAERGVIPLVAGDGIGGGCPFSKSGIQYHRFDIKHFFMGLA
jgi:hypothetical protein